MVKLFLLILLFVVCSLAKVGYFWQITDPHFDSIYKVGGDMENCNYEFICCRYTFPNTTRKAGQFGAPEGKFCNTPLVTIQSTFDFMKTYSQRLTPKPTFLIMGGDFHGHDMDLQTKASTLQKLNEFTEFAEGMKSGMKVFPTIGNHDGFPCDQLDYRPGNDMFNEYSKIWAKHRFTSESISNIRKGAYYTELIIPGLRIITMNTQIFSRTNYYMYIDEKIDHAEQMKFLDEVLESSMKKKEKVIISGHIPPLGTSERWFPHKLDQFEKIIQKYHSIIIGQFYGHAHEDSFSFMVDNDNKIINKAFIGGVVTPLSRKNPTTRLYKYDADTFELLDYEDFYIPLKEAEESGKIIWKKLYQFTEEYNLPDLSNDSFEKLYQSFKTSDEYWNKFNLNYHSRWANRNCQGGCKKNNLCRMISPTQERFKKCMRQ